MKGDLKASEVAIIRRREGRPVLHWHPMKTGGTTLCFMAKDAEFTENHVKYFGFNLDLNCKMGRKENNLAARSASLISTIPTVSVMTSVIVLCRRATLTLIDGDFSPTGYLSVFMLLLCVCG